jgi:hypothetical protein
MVDILDDGGYVEVVEDLVNREIVVIEVMSSELSNGGSSCHRLTSIVLYSDIIKSVTITKISWNFSLNYPKV